MSRKKAKTVDKKNSSGKKEIKSAESKHFQHLFHQMLRIRQFEEKAAELYGEMKIRGFLHLYIGEEAVATGVTEVLSPDDNLVATYREHGYALLRGIPAGTIMAEMYGKKEGCCLGRGGSMHLFDSKTRLFGGNAIVGGGLPVAVGLALADKMQGNKRITCCIFGDGAVAEGEFHESMNLASLWHLPVLFICENNYYAMGTALRFTHAVTDLAGRAVAYNVKSSYVDGMEVRAVEEAVKNAAGIVRKERAPYFLECRTYRFRAHSMFDSDRYRTREEIEEWKKKDPVVNFRQFVLDNGYADGKDLGNIEKDVQDEIDEAVAFAESGTWEDVEDLTKHVYSEKNLK